MGDLYIYIFYTCIYCIYIYIILYCIYIYHIPLLCWTLPKIYHVAYWVNNYYRNKVKRNLAPLPAPSSGVIHILSVFICLGGHWSWVEGRSGLKHISLAGRKQRIVSPTCRAEDVHAHLLCTDRGRGGRVQRSPWASHGPDPWDRLFENVILLISIQPVKEACDDKGIENRSNNASSWSL